MNNTNISYEYLVQKSPKIQKIKEDCISACKLSLTGITNLVVNYEDPLIINLFLQDCFSTIDLYNGTYDIDAVELQEGAPGHGNAISYIDRLIYGTYRVERRTGDYTDSYIKNQKTGKRERNPDGFVNREKILKDKLLIIKNIDYCIDFCSQNPGEIDNRSVWIFDNFRNPSIKKNFRMLLVTNEPVKMPFKIRSVGFEPVDDFDAEHIINSFIHLYQNKNLPIIFSDNHTKQITRKLKGLTYTESSDAFAESLSKSIIDNNINTNILVKNLRERINRNLLDEATGLTHLVAKPWEDYITSKASNFTFDVKKIIRDFNEINEIKAKINEENKELMEKSIESVRARMPHVILLYGKGGVGKSSFPLHFAGLLEFDVWDFNINALHSKWVGEGSERMRNALEKITKASHLIVRIDEYDRAIGSTENSSEGMHSAHKQVESEFMNWLQNSQDNNVFLKNDLFIVITSNHKDNITGPLLRSGRVDLVISIDDFDVESIKSAFLSSHKRMQSRGVEIIGFNSYEEFNNSILKLDLNEISLLAYKKHFTLKDIDILLQEMAAHDYYFKKGKSDINWSNESFIAVLKNSTGSSRPDGTGELILGDRFLPE